MKITTAIPQLRTTDLAESIRFYTTMVGLTDWLGETESARRVREAVDGALADGTIAIRPDGTVVHGTRAGGQAVIDRLKR